MQERNVINPTKNTAEEPLEKALRPQSLSEFIGQQKLCENLEIFIKAAKKRGEALDHVLLAGPPGLGKTTLSQIVAKELGVGFRATSGPVITKAGDLAAILTNLQENDVLFIDEIHRLNKTVEEILYPAMEDNKLDLIIGEGAGARSVQIDLPQFTLIAATTRSGLLSTPLRERFGIPLRLDFYTPDELCNIVERSGRLLNMNLELNGALEIAKRSRGTPRVANRLTRRVRDISSVLDQDIINQNVADSALSRLDVDKNGLDAWDIKYLTLMAGNYAGGPVGIETMAASLGEERDVIEDVIEPYLLQQGYISRTPRGRCLTQKSYKYLGINVKTTDNQDLFE